MTTESPPVVSISISRLSLPIQALSRLDSLMDSRRTTYYDGSCKTAFTFYKYPHSSRTFKAVGSKSKCKMG